LEPHLGNPDRVATLAPALDHVGIACILLASAAGPEDQIAALHGTRLAMLLTRMVDSTVRGIVYEGRGAVAQEVLRGGAQLVQAACGDSLIPYAVLDAEPSDHAAWAAAAHGAVARLLR
jgi:hypothetical protein